ANAVEKWTFEYLESNMAQSSEWRVHIAPAPQRRFQRVYGEGVGEGVVTLMNFTDFAEKSASDSGHAYYMQVPFVGRPLEAMGTDPYGDAMREDRENFQWPWLRQLIQDAQLGPMENNQLWIGRGGSLTPCHYDKAENLHAQICGEKQFLLIPPEETFAVYPYPIDHPLDSFAMVDLEQPDLDRFPAFADVQCLEASLEPGDLLYLPRCAKEMNSPPQLAGPRNQSLTYLTEGYGDNISLNFWLSPSAQDQNEDEDGMPIHMRLFQEAPRRCWPLLAHRFLEDFSGGMIERFVAAKALPADFDSKRFLQELAFGWAEDTPPGLQPMGAQVRGVLASLMPGASPEELEGFLRGTAASPRLTCAPSAEAEVTTASEGQLGGWLSEPIA
ncbi:hif1an, partial [Symbiodinium pilosum]